MTMKLRYLLWGLALCTLWSCSDDDEGFDLGIDSSAFTFTPAPGGAVMHYRLPANSDITGLYVYYKDAYGKDIVRSGSTAADSLVLTGFNEAQAAVSAQVRLFSRDRNESRPIDVTFSTEDSDPVAFMKTVNVISDWEGFTMVYEKPRNGAEGLVHVFYLGTDPLSDMPDTLLVNTLTLNQMKSYEQLNYRIKQDITHPIVVVRVEDFRGHIVGERAFDQIECMYPEKLSPSAFDFYCTASIIDEDRKIGPQYLFDGDTKGILPFSINSNQGTDCLYSYVAGPNAAGSNAIPMYIDLRTNKVIGSLRIYNEIPNSKEGSYTFTNCNFRLGMIPRDIQLFAAVDDGKSISIDKKSFDELNWIPLSSYKDEEWADVEAKQKNSLTELTEAEEEYEILNCSAQGQGEGFRYLKIVINEVRPIDDFAQWLFLINNTDNYVAIHELEIYTKKDN